MISVKAVFQRLVKFSSYVGTMSTNTAFEVPLVRGDTGPVLQFTVLDQAKQPIAVSGMAVNFYMRPARVRGAPTNNGHEACYPVDLPNGVWGYDLAPGDVSGIAGTYFGDVEIVYDDGRIETAYEQVRFLVRDNNKG